MTVFYTHVSIVFDQSDPIHHLSGDDFNGNSIHIFMWDGKCWCNCQTVGIFSFLFYPTNVLIACERGNNHGRKISTNFFLPLVDDIQFVGWSLSAVCSNERERNSHRRHLHFIPLFPLFWAEKKMSNFSTIFLSHSPFIRF